MPRRSKVFPLDPTQAIIPVDVLIEGPQGRHLIRMALDSGATYTMVPVSALRAIGYDPAISPNRIEFVAAGGVEYKSLMRVRAVSALGVRVPQMEVVAHDLPPQSPVRGLLGLNFLKHLSVHLDFPRRVLRITS